MAEGAESDIAIRFVADYREICAKAVSAKRKLKKNRPSWLVSKHCYEAVSSSEEDEKVSGSEEEAVTETESANEIVYKKT